MTDGGSRWTWHEITVSQTFLVTYLSSYVKSARVLAHTKGELYFLKKVDKAAGMQLAPRAWLPCIRLSDCTLAPYHQAKHAGTWLQGQLLRRLAQEDHLSSGA